MNGRAEVIRRISCSAADTIVLLGFPWDNLFRAFQFLAITTDLDRSEGKSAVFRRFTVGVNLMVVWLAVLVGIYVLGAGPGGIWPNLWSRSWQRLTSGGPRKVETIRYVDGPLAGQTGQLRVGPDRLPPLQFCAVVHRSVSEGGNYTLPYQRGLICGTSRAWRYTEGWTDQDLAHAGIEDWQK
jgi:hypothetical protein